MYKYCLNNNVETPCSETSITEHCVATTMAKEKLDNSLKALLFQKGIDEIKAGNLIKGKKIFPFIVLHMDYFVFHYIFQKLQ